MQDQQTIYAGNDVVAALGRRHQGRSTMAGGIIVDWKLEVGSRLFSYFIFRIKLLSSAWG